MKSATFLKLLLLVLPLVFVSTRVLANELDSPNYKMIGVSTSGGGGIMESTNYSMISNVGRISADPRNYSTNYRLDQDPAAIFRAAQPTIQCFETDTNGTTTNCTSGPQELTDGGMIAICGPGGCYNKARFEIGSVPYMYSSELSGLVSYWPMDETSGTTVRDVAGTNPGTATGTTITNGRFANARNFNGTSDLIQVTSSTPLQVTGDLTLSAWINSPLTARSNIVYKHYDYEFDFGIEPNGGLNFWHGDGAWEGTVGQGVGSVQANTWTHVAAVRTMSDNRVRFYVDGQYVAQWNFTKTPASSANPVRIGSRGTAHQFTGMIDEVMIFNQALSASNIEDLYEAQAPNINPSDTLYMIQISTDNFVSDIKCVDGSILKPKTLSNCDINDFRTKTNWESEDFNLRGLQGDITYYIRASALHGDFTQSDFSIPANATTTAGGIEFDIDIATSTGYDTESSPPYSIEFSGSQTLMGGGVAMTSPSLIWLDIESSSVGGVAIIQFGKYGGLYSSTTTETIQSTNLDLDSSGAEGFGLQNYYIDHEISTYLGYLTATTNYFGVGNTVGEVSTTARKIYDGDGPISAGRTGLYVKARASSSRTPASDYTESIYFILVPRY